MKQLINIYSDESCHLESKEITQDNRFMVIGGISCPDSSKTTVFEEIKKIKSENGLKHFSEIKWKKISRSKFEPYQKLMRYFFECQGLSFRAVIIDKKQLNHERFDHTHDQFYYKMYWQMLEWFIEPSNRYHIFLDIKDTQGYVKVQKLHEVLCNSHHDFNREVIEKIQEVRSHEIALMQLVDVLIGAIAYANRYQGEGKSPVKQSMVDLIKELSGFSLISTTSIGARKFNLFRWEGKR